MLNDLSFSDVLNSIRYGTESSVFKWTVKVCLLAADGSSTSYWEAGRMSPSVMEPSLLTE
ncbi:hypothetical protein PO124_34215 [Bacillus licheniformis]|nr:hypothetical protein [Bacillus licheniformis]